MNLPKIDWPHEITLGIMAIGVSAGAVAQVSAAPGSPLFAWHSMAILVGTVCTALAGLNLTKTSTPQKFGGTHTDGATTTTEPAPPPAPPTAK